jgi:hypothetical protein
MTLYFMFAWAVVGWIGVSHLDPHAHRTGAQVLLTITLGGPIVWIVALSYLMTGDDK